MKPCCLQLIMYRLRRRCTSWQNRTTTVSLNYAETRELHNLLNGMETFGSGEQDMEKVKKSPKIRSKIGKNPVDGKERER